MIKTKHLTFVPDGNGLYWIKLNSLPNGLPIGSIYLEIDGIWVAQLPGSGAWSGYILREISDAIDRLNQDLK